MLWGNCIYIYAWGKQRGANTLSGNGPRIIGTRALHWVPIPMPMGFGWARVRYYWSWVGMGAILLVILLVMLQFLNTWAQFEKHGWAWVGTCQAMDGHGWAWVGIGGHRSLLMGEVWVWVQIQRNCWALQYSKLESPSIPKFKFYFPCYGLWMI